MNTSDGNADRETVRGFGYEWTKFDQSGVEGDAMRRTFAQYFALFPWDVLPTGAIGFDLGCGSGRWARLVAARVGRVVCLDASGEALKVAMRNAPSCPVVQAVAGRLPLLPGSMDFGYSLGVLHHIPDPLDGLTDAVSLLRPNAPFLVYLYYAFDNRPAWFRSVWLASDLVRQAVSRFPPPVRYGVSQVLAASVYVPLARFGRLLERRVGPVPWLPLYEYRHRSFYVMRNDALDRFGTRLERRFTRDEVVELLERAGLERVQVSDDAPYWCAIGFKGAS